MKKQFSLLIFLIIVQISFAQWTYPGARKFNSDVIITYSVNYERELTEAEKRLPDFMPAIRMMVGEDKILKTFLLDEFNINLKKVLYDYKEQKIYVTKRSKRMYNFSNPRKEVVLKNKNAKQILGTSCTEYYTIIHGREVKLYTTKDFGLRYSKNYKAEGFLMEYTGYNTNLGFYTVKAEKIERKSFSDNYFTQFMVGFKSVEEAKKERRKDRISSLKIEEKMLDKKAKSFKAITLNQAKISSKKIKKEEKVLVLCFWLPSEYSKKSIPQLNKLYNTYKDNKNVELLVISPKKRKTLEKYRDLYNIEIPLAPDFNEISFKYSVKKYPTSVIIDKKGVIKLYRTGYGKNMEAVMSKAIKILLEE